MFSVIGSLIDVPSQKCTERSHNSQGHLLFLNLPDVWMTCVDLWMDNKSNNNKFVIICANRSPTFYV